MNRRYFIGGIGGVISTFSGCISSIDGTNPGEAGQSSDDSTDQVSGCREDQDDVLMVIRPTESVSDSTWEEIRDVARERYSNIGGFADSRIDIQRINGTQAVTIAMPRTDYEMLRRRFLMQPSFTIYIGTQNDWSEIADEETYEAFGTVTKRDTDDWYIPFQLGSQGIQRLQTVVSDHPTNLQIRATVNGDTVGSKPLPDGLRNVAEENEFSGRLRVPVDSEETATQFRLAGKQPSFPVEITTSQYECTDGAKDEGD